MRLTVNQIMLLLDIYRGTSTQDEIGTRRDNIKILVQKNLIISSIVSDEITELGNQFVQLIISDMELSIPIVENESHFESKYNEDPIYSMKIGHLNNPFPSGDWREEVHLTSRGLTEKNVVENCEKIVKYFNQTLRPGEHMRQLIGVYKEVKYIKSTKL